MNNLKYQEVLEVGFKLCFRGEKISKQVGMTLKAVNLIIKFRN